MNTIGPMIPRRERWRNPLSRVGRDALTGGGTHADPSIATAALRVPMNIR
ncbi:hypothetical protein [Microbacterium petrolearium]|jgi:hypothetical protein